MKSRISILSLALSVLIWAPSVKAAPPTPTEVDDHKPYSGLSMNIKYAKMRAAPAVMYGVQYTHYETKGFGIGGAIYQGEMMGAKGGRLTMGGIDGNYTTPYTPGWWQTLGLFTGAVGGTFKTKLDPNSATLSDTKDGGVLFEPYFGFRFNFGRMARSWLTGGYAISPGNNHFTGFTLSARVEFLF